MMDDKITKRKRNDYDDEYQHKRSNLNESSLTNYSDVSYEIAGSSSSHEYNNYISEYAKDSKQKISDIFDYIQKSVTDKYVFCKVSKVTGDKCIHVVNINSSHKNSIYLDYYDLKYLFDNYGKSAVMNIMNYFIYFSKFKIINEANNEARKKQI